MPDQAPDPQTSLQLCTTSSLTCTTPQQKRSHTSAPGALPQCPLVEPTLFYTACCRFSVSELTDKDVDQRQLHEDLATAIVDSYVHNPVDLAVRRPEGLHVRYLPPGRVSDLFQLYRAAMHAAKAPAAGAVTFRKAWKLWHAALKFRRTSTHALCQTCHRLRSLVRHSKTLQEHMTASAMLLEHMRSQWADRQVYWRMRDMSRAGSCLCLITDGMDRSKFGLPIWGRSPKGVAEHIKRPCLEVAATIVHGVGLFLWVADEDQTIGSEWVMEVTMRALEASFKRFQLQNKEWPAHLICQADNTCRESKNSHFMRLLMSLVSVGAFSAATAQFLQVGHTHEDVDAVFGLVANALKNNIEELQTPEQICHLLQRTLEPVFARRGEIVQIQYVTSVRPWKDILPSTVGFTGCFRTRAAVDGGDNVEAPHSFTFVFRGGAGRLMNAQCLPAIGCICQIHMETIPGMQSKLLEVAEDTRPRSQRTLASPNDVYVLVKQHMHDDQLSQPPILVFPVNMAPLALRTFQLMNEVEGVFPSCQGVCRQSFLVEIATQTLEIQTKGRRPGFDAERLLELRRLQDVLRCYPQYKECVKYVQRLATARPGPAPPITFVSFTLQHRRVSRPQVRQPVPGPEAHELRVVYKRPRA